MSYLIAVSSTDRKVVNQHFGKSLQFLIYEVDNGQYKFLEIRNRSKYCNSNDREEHDENDATEGLKGCRAVVVSQIGPGAKEALGSQNVEVFVVKDWIENALLGVIQYYDEMDK